MSALPPQPQDALASRRQAALPSSRVLLAWLVVFCAMFFLELPGSFPVEPDEGRYAEIPREMLATGNWLVPKLNYVDYFEKPPLLYWANAVSFETFGLNAYASRLPCRLATLGTLLLLVVGLRKRFGERVALASGLIFLSAPLVFSVGRIGLTDGLLGFTMAIALFSLHEFLLAREEAPESARRARAAAAFAGLGCGLSVLTKGLVGVVLPGGALLLWCAVSGRWRRIFEILLSPAPVVFLLVTVPYFWAVERAAPGFSQFFWIREHFARYATHEASRPGPPYYFLLTFFAGFLPWSFFLPRVAGRLMRSIRAIRENQEGLSELWFASWTVVILVFFSLSRSKLIPYVLPMAPAAAVLLAVGLDSGPSPRRGLFANAVFWVLAVPAGVWLGLRSGEISRYATTGLALAAGLGLIAFGWAAASLSRGRPSAALALLPAGWACVYAAAILVLPALAVDQSAQGLAVAAGRAAGGGAEVVSYRTYLQGFPWVLRRRIRIYGWKGELEFGSLRGDQSAWFRPREDFWKDWDSGKKMVVLMRRRDQPEMEKHRANLVAENRKYLVAKNF